MKDHCLDGWKGKMYSTWRNSFLEHYCTSVQLSRHGAVLGYERVSFILTLSVAEVSTPHDGSELEWFWVEPICNDTVHRAPPPTVHRHSRVRQTRNALFYSLNRDPALEHGRTHNRSTHHSVRADHISLHFRVSHLGWRTSSPLISISVSNFLGLSLIR